MTTLADAKPKPSRRGHSERILRALPALVIVAAIGLVGGLWWMLDVTLSHNREATRTAAETSAGNLAQAFEGHVLRTIKDVDHALLMLRREWSAGHEHFMTKVALLQEAYEGDLLLQIAVIGADGRLRSSNLQAVDNPDLVDLSDREHFRVHRERVEDALFISKPIFGRVSGKVTLQFTRRINGPRGEFAGVLVASVEPDYFERFFGRIDIGEQGDITLIGLDRVIRARASRSAYDDTVIHTVPADRPFLRGGTTGGVYRNDSIVDGVSRISGYRVVPGYPLVVQVGLAEKEVYAPYLKWRRTLWVWAVVLSVPLLLAAGALARSLALQQRYRLSLVEDARQLEAANNALSRQQKQLQLANERLRVLNDIALLPNASTGDKLANAMRQGAAHLHLELGFVVRATGDEAVLEHCLVTPPYELKANDRLPLDRTRFGATIAHGDVLAIADMDAATHAGLPQEPGIPLGCYIGVPLIAQGVPYGALSFGSPRPYEGGFDESDLEFLRLLGRWASSLLTEELTRAELQRLATTDPLTGAANRRAFMEAGQRELDRSRRFERPFSVLMLDIDHFKRVNDTFGHQTGDQALILLANTCRGVLRDCDLFGRLGGEEFAVLLPETDAERAVTVAERVREAVAASSLPAGAETVRYTISLGLAQADAGDSMDSILRHADRCLYLAKQQGRNRTVAMPREAVA